MVIMIHIDMLLALSMYIDMRLPAHYNTQHI